MASAYGPEPAPGASIHALGDPEPMTDVEATSPPVDSLDRAAPPPNPPFSFPMRADAPSSAPPTTTPASRASRRRPMSAIETPTQSYQLAAEATERPQGRASLPAFSFNPGAALPPDPNDPMLSPPMSPQSTRTLPSGEKPIRHGHRRGGSEFVGGRLREGNSIAVMNGSPTKAESGFNSPNLAPPRRGHRRGVSSALSTNDLSLLPPPQHDFSFKGSSAPNSPTNFDQIPAMPPIPAKFQEQAAQATPEMPEAQTTADSPENLPKEKSETPIEEDQPPKPASRTRVGFSDTLEFIPRPLSLVSTDTSSTITAKPGHAVSGSISSLVNHTSPSGRESPAAKSHSPSREGSRPSTAGAILERTPTIQADGFDASPRRRNSIPALLDLAEASAVEPPTPSPTKSSKRWTFFGLDPFSSHGSPSKTRPHSASSGESAIRVVSGTSSSDHGSDSPAEGADPNCKTGKKKSKRRKMVKGWADSILPRKPKQGIKRSKYSVRPPTPPASIVPPEEDDEDAMDIDQPAQAPPTVTITESPTPPRPAKQRAEDVSSPMIDLDAALGPFNTPLPSNPEWDAAQRAAGNANRRRLHSAQGMRGFSGPGMHYHRRAESAPDLPPFDPGPSSIHRFGSSSTMADVFEEDEDEAEDDNQSSKPAASTHSTREEETDGDATPPALAPSDPIKEPARSIRRKSSGLSDKDQSSVASIRAQRSKTSLHDNVIVEEPSSNVRFRTNNVFGEGPDGSASPTMSLRKTSGNRDLPPFELGPPPVPYANMPVSPHSMSYASSPRSPMSADTQRLSTAPSSVHEDNSFHSLLMGEPGPEVRLSADYDIPSLTSSNSTMTRDSNFPSHARMSQPTLREPRPLSVSSAAFGRRRSSLVSLSRLISSSHGERSKLSMEVTLDNDAENKKSRHSKTKRLGRLVQFWKPKEGAQP